MAAECDGATCAICKATLATLEKYSLLLTLNFFDGEDWADEDKKSEYEALESEISHLKAKGIA